MKRFEDFTTEDLKKLRSEICLNSLYVSDYNNSFGLDPHYVSDFFDGFVSFIDELANEDGKKNMDCHDLFEQYDTIDNLVSWYCCFDEFGAKYDFTEADEFEQYDEILLTSKEHFGDEEEHEFTMRFYDGVAYLYDEDDADSYFKLEYPSMKGLMQNSNKWQQVTDYTGRKDVNPYDIALKFGKIVKE